MIKARVDFNSRGRDGLVRGSLRRADGVFVKGDRVQLIDIEDPAMTYVALVVEVDDQGRALFDVEWETSDSVVTWFVLPTATNGGVGTAKPTRTGWTAADAANHGTTAPAYA